MLGSLRLRPGAVFAHDYEVLRPIASGGMGAVYAVRDRRTGEEQAMKVLLPELVAEERPRRRFLQEAQIAMQLAHDGIPRVYHTGIDDEGGIPFIVMELLRGEDLRARIKSRGPMSMEEAAPIFAALAEVLGSAHREGLVHRDVKPENVFLHGPSERVKLLDFGVAKLIDAHRTSGTGTGAVGSPMWMAPEQTSAGGRIACCTDVWAFGLLTFYVLTGRIYWKAAQDESGIGGLLRELHVDPVEPASTRAAWLGLGVTFSREYDAWFLRAVARDHAARFRDAHEMWEAFAPVLDAPAPSGDRSAVAFAETVSVDRSEVSSVLPSRPPASHAPPAYQPPAYEPHQGRTPPMGGGHPLPLPPAVPSVSTPPPGAPASHAPPARSVPPEAWQTGSDPGGIPPTDPPGPIPVGASPRRVPAFVWVLLVLLVGVLVATLSGMIVWVILTITEPTAPAPRPTAPTLEPASPLEPVAPQPVGSIDT